MSSAKNTYITFTVTNNLNYDQRMQRICNSLSQNGYNVLLIGVQRKNDEAIVPQAFEQKRLKVWFANSVLFYIEYNIKLFFFLLFQKADVYTAIDLDTILPNYLVSIIKRKKRVYDAHEFFTEMKEVITRPFVKKIWTCIEKFTVPHFTKGYTVNTFIQQKFLHLYKVNYSIVRNIPVLHQDVKPLPTLHMNPIPVLLYQGAVNEGRGFEQLIPAMKLINAELHIYGKGNFFEQTQQLIKTHQLQHKVLLKGSVPPKQLKAITPTATVGLTLFEANGINQYNSLANRFFDYIMAGIPQICVNYPEYKEINNIHQVAFMVNNIEAPHLAADINSLLSNEPLLQQLKQNTLKAREILNWSNEEKHLLNFWFSV